MSRWKFDAFQDIITFKLIYLWNCLKEIRKYELSKITIDLINNNLY